MRLIVLAKSTQVAEIACGEEAIYIGSDGQCDIRLPDPEIPGQLGVIYAEDDGVWVFEQLSELEIVHYNGAEIVDKVRVSRGDQIRIREYLIRAEGESDQPVKQTEDAGEPRAVKRTSVARLAQFVQYHLPPGTVTKKTDESITANPEHMSGVAVANVKLGQCDTVEQLMDNALTSVLDMLGANRAWLGVRRLTYGGMDYVEGRFTGGKTADLPETGEKIMPRVLDREQYVLLPYGDDSYKVSMIVGPLIGPDGPIGMIFIDAGHTKRRYTTSDLDGFILLLNTIAAQLDAIFKKIAGSREAMLKGEVTVSHAIQTRLTPRKLPQWDELQFGAFREMGRERTSDIYDVLKLSNNMALFMIAQTSASGPLPSMLMAQAQAAFRVAAMHLDSPHIFLKSLNALLYDGQQDHALDCFVGVIEPPTGNMRFARAGQMGAYIISADGGERFLAARQPTPPLSLTREPAYELYPEKLKPGETLALFTSGVAAARNSRGDIFGEDRFVSLLCDGFGQLASNMLKEMLHDLQHFTEGGAQPDDITVILAHRP